MRKAIYLLPIFLFSAIWISAQTKKIAYKSHSGNMATYVDDKTSFNFGLNEELILEFKKRKEKQDSLLKVNSKKVKKIKKLKKEPPALNPPNEQHQIPDFKEVKKQKKQLKKQHKKKQIKLRKDSALIARQEMPNSDFSSPKPMWGYWLIGFLGIPVLILAFKKK